MPPAEFEPTIPESERPHIYTLNRAATSISFLVVKYKNFIKISANTGQRDNVSDRIKLENTGLVTAIRHKPA
jgi:hypothetical protein